MRTCPAAAATRCPPPTSTSDPVGPATPPPWSPQHLPHPTASPTPPHLHPATALTPPRPPPRCPPTAAAEIEGPSPAQLRADTQAVARPHGASQWTMTPPPGSLPCPAPLSRGGSLTVLWLHLPTMAKEGFSVGWAWALSPLLSVPAHPPTGPNPRQPGRGPETSLPPTAAPEIKASSFLF